MELCQPQQEQGTWTTEIEEMEMGAKLSARAHTYIVTICYGSGIRHRRWNFQAIETARDPHEIRMAIRGNMCSQCQCNMDAVARLRM